MAGPVKIVILGAGGTGVDVVDLLGDLGQPGPGYDCVGFLDDAVEKHGTTVAGLPVLGSLKTARETRGVMFVNALGSPTTYRRIPGVLEQLGLPVERYVTLIHPSAVVSRQATLGPGCVVYPHVTIAACARLGRFVTVLSQAVINHHAVLGDHVIVASHASISGGVHIGSSCYIGAACSIREGVSVGAGAMVGMGSVVLHDVRESSVVAGNPAELLTS
jgi:sugar O-acyltransferase (sialic acid O-acetyltransferase NeuD family)